MADADEPVHEWCGHPECTDCYPRRPSPEMRVLELEIGKLTLERGDVLVVRSRKDLTMHEAELIKASVREMTMRLLPGSTIQIIFLPHWIDLSVLTKADIEKHEVHAPDQPNAAGSGPGVREPSGEQGTDQGGSGS